MQYNPTTTVLALQAQRRYFDQVRFDGPVTPARPHSTVRVALAALLERSARFVAPADSAIGRRLTPAVN